MQFLLANLAPYWTQPELTPEQLDQLQQEGLIERRLAWSKLYRLTDKGVRAKAQEPVECMAASD